MPCMFSAEQRYLHEGSCATLIVIEGNHQLPSAYIISNDKKNAFLKRTYYPLIFDL